MNFQERFDLMDGKIASWSAEILLLKQAYESAMAITTTLLGEAEKVGLTKVAIGRSHKSIPESVGFPYVSCSVFGIGGPLQGRDKNGWPAIWGVAERAGIYAGCGNHMQAQIDSSRVVDGIYHLKNGAWKRVEE